VSEKTVIPGMPAVRLTPIQPHELHICACLRGAAARAGATDPSRGRHCRTVWRKNTRSLCIHSKHPSVCIQDATNPQRIARILVNPTYGYCGVKRGHLGGRKTTSLGLQRARHAPIEIAACRSNAFGVRYGSDTSAKADIASGPRWAQDRSLNRYGARCDA
jgi:hypothetical protein